MLDTDSTDPRDRFDMLAAAVQEASAPSHLVRTSPYGAVFGHIDIWRLGHVHIKRGSFSDVRLVRTPEQIKSSPTPLLCVQLQMGGMTRLTHADTRVEFRPGRLYLLDLDLEYELDWIGGRVTSVHIPHDKLNVSVETIRAALLRPQCSPLYPLIANQIALMSDSSDALEGDPAAPALGDAFAEMVRAYLLSAARQSNPDGTALPRDILLTQIRDYAHRRLCDPNLSPAQIARAHHISVRHLYKVCADAGFSPEKWIVAQRLERAHSDLARFDMRHRSIGAIAYSLGFRSPTHFARRLYAAYGLTPSRLRREALEQQAADLRLLHVDDTIDVQQTTLPEHRAR
ncbi:helix-turn-helix domain-containing protein [Nocardia sp. CA-128927]|uniref:helix-turn-helix domain-containing protein n=1 Tax=Nocardia sp. CA-128927 TaxID=3239975 RepID=UPI003D96B8A3